MKKYLSILTVAAIVCSCSNNEINEITPTKNNNEITFTTLRDKVNTRYANDNKSTYIVYAQISSASAWYFNTTVTCGDDVTDDYTDDTSAGTYYWPGTQKVNFYAYSPSTTGTTTGVTSVSATYPDLNVTYTVPTAADMDFTIAAPVNQDGSTSKTVKLAFSHMLSKVVISVALSSSLPSGYTIEDGYTANFTVPYNSGTISAKSNTSTWGSMGTAGSHTYSGALSYIIMPQTYTTANPCTIEIKDITIKYGNVVFFNGDLSVCTLSTTAISDAATFAMGNQYNLTLTITDLSTDEGGDKIFNGEIEFSSTVATWTPVTVGVTQP